MPRARKELRPSDLTYIVDNREQRPLDLSPVLTIQGTLATGDYSVVGLEHVIAVERKSLDDLLGCVGRERERFEREIQRLQGYDCRAIIVEATWADVTRGQWRSKVAPAAVLGSLLGWIAMGIPVVMAGSHAEAAKMTGRIMFLAARRRWREAAALCDTLRLVSSETETSESN